MIPVPRMASISNAVKISALFAMMVMSSAGSFAGVKTTITQKGLNEINTVVMDIVNSRLTGEKLKDFSVGSGGLSYQFTNVILQSMEGFTSAITPTTGQTVAWILSVSKLNVDSSWFIEYKRTILGKEKTLFSDSGTLEAEVGSSSVSLTINIQVVNGHLDVALQSCNPNVGEIDLDFSGSILSTIYDTVTNIFISRLESDLNEQICEAVNTALNNVSSDMIDFSTEIQTTILDLPLSFDYSLTNIETGDTFISSFHKGVFRWQDEEATFFTDDREFPSLIEHDYMLSMTIREAVISSLLDITTTNDLLDGELSTKDIELTNDFDMNLSCPVADILCIGAILPEAARLYPNYEVYIRGEIEDASFSVTSTDFISSVRGRIYFHAYTDSDDVVLFSATLSMNLALQIAIQDNELRMRIGNINGSLVVDQSNIGKVITEDVDILTAIDKSIMLNAFRENMNKWTTYFPISLPRDITIADTAVILSDGFITIGINFCYKRPCQSADGTDWTPLVSDIDFSNFNIYDITTTPSTVAKTPATTKTTVVVKNPTVTKSTSVAKKPAFTKKPTPAMPITKPEVTKKPAAPMPTTTLQVTKRPAVTKEPAPTMSTTAQSLRYRLKVDGVSKGTQTCLSTKGYVLIIAIACFVYSHI